MYTRSSKSTGARVLAACAALILLTSLGGSAQSTCEAVVPIIVRPENSKVQPRNGDFVLGVNGARIKGTLLDRKPGGRHVAVLLDTSGSMRAYWQVARYFAAEIVQEFDASDDVTYARFGAKIDQSPASSGDRKAILAAIDTTELPAGRTALRDAIAAAVAQPTLAKNDVIVIVTDGFDNLSKMQESPLLAELTARRVRVFAILVREVMPLGLESSRVAGENEALQSLQRLVESTGGFVMWPQQVGIRFGGNPPGPDDASLQKIRAALRVLANAIDRPNLVRFALPMELPASKKSPQIELTDDAGHKLKGLRLVYPQQPLDCDQPVATPAKPN